MWSHWRVNTCFRFLLPGQQKKKPFFFLLVSYCTTDRLPSETRRSIKTLLFLPFLCLGGQVGLFFSSFSGGFWSVCCYGFIYMARAVSRESAGLHQLPSLTYNPSSGGTWLLKQKHHDDGWRLMWRQRVPVSDFPQNETTLASANGQRWDSLVTHKAYFVRVCLYTHTDMHRMQPSSAVNMKEERAISGQPIRLLRTVFVCLRLNVLFWRLSYMYVWCVLFPFFLFLSSPHSPNHRSSCLSREYILTDPLDGPNTAASTGTVDTTDGTADRPFPSRLRLAV